MKKKLFAFLLLIFGMCGTLSYFSFSDIASASSVTASVWDGTYCSNVNELTDDDWYEKEEGGKKQYYIRSAKGLSYFANLVNTLKSDSTYISFTNSDIYLETDIDLNNEDWLPIGGSSTSKTQSFKGCFYGNGHTIYNLNCVEGALGGVGFFGAIGLDNGIGSQVNIKDLHFKNATIDIQNPKTTNQETNIGIIAGKVFEKVGISNCSVQGAISIEGALVGSGLQNLNVGGIVGLSNKTTFGGTGVNSANGVKSDVMINIDSSTSVSSGSVVSVGGIAGKMVGSKIYYSANVGEINLNNVTANVGGIVGSMQSNI